MEMNWDYKQMLKTIAPSVRATEFKNDDGTQCLSIVSPETLDVLTALCFFAKRSKYNHVIATNTNATSIVVAQTTIEVDAYRKVYHT